MRRAAQICAAAPAFAAALCLWSLPADAHKTISTQVTWNREIAAIVGERCVSCHRPGGFAFSLASYADARPWAVAIKEMTLGGAMPPWGAAPGIGHFANDRRLSRHEQELIAAWVDGGAPEARERVEAGKGEPGGPSANEPAAAASEPVTAAAAGVEGGTVVPLATAVITTTTERSASVTVDVPANIAIAGWAFEPGVPALVDRVDLELGTTWLGTWTPGSPPIQFPDGITAAQQTAVRLTARIRYKAPPERVIDHSRLRIWFGPAGTKVMRDTLVLRSWRTPRAVTLFGLRPQDGARTEVVVRFAEGRVLPLGAFERPGHAPHPTYVLARPVAVPAGALVQTNEALRLLYVDEPTRSVRSKVRRRPRR